MVGNRRVGLDLGASKILRERTRWPRRSVGQRSRVGRVVILLAETRWRIDPTSASGTVEVGR